MLDLPKLKSKAEELLLQIDDLLELFHSNQDALLLDKIPSILTELSEITPPDFEKAHTQIHRFSELLEIQDYDSLQDELLFFISHLDQPQNNVDIPDDSSEPHSTASFSQDAILLLDDFLEEAEERLNSFEQSLIKYRNEPLIEYITVAFRDIHTLKGGFRFIESYAEENLCHICEDLLAQWRDGAVAVNWHKITILLDTVQKLRDAIDHIALFRTPTQQDYQEIISAIEEDHTEKILPTIAIFRPLLNGPTETECSLEAIAELRNLITEDLEIGQWEELSKKAKELSFHNIEILSICAVKILQSTKPNSEYEVSLSTLQQSISNILATAERIGKEIDVIEASSSNLKMQESIEYIRVPSQKIDDIFQNLIEFEIMQGRLIHYIPEEERQSLSSHVKKITKDIEHLRQQKLEVLFQRIPKIVSDISKQLKKEVRVVIEGEHLRLNRRTIEVLQGPLLHLIRNAIDHGIETPLDRRKSGKEGRATIVISASQREQNIYIEISDDGKGIDREQILQKARERQFISKDEILTQREALHLIFRPGFSTKNTQDKLSGRGVGLDVVYSTIKELSGELEVHTEIGVGTHFELMIPVSDVALPHLKIKIDERCSFFIPANRIKEIIQIENQSMQNTGFITYRGQDIPYIPLHKSIEHTDIDHEEHYACIIQIQAYVFAVGVYAVIDIEDVVVQQVPLFFEEASIYSGVTIDKDRHPIFIIDLPYLITAFDLREQTWQDMPQRREIQQLFVSICRDQKWYSLPLHSLQHHSSNLLQISEAQPFTKIYNQQRIHFLYFYVEQQLHFIDIDEMGDITEGNVHPHIKILQEEQ